MKLIEPGSPPPFFWLHVKKSAGGSVRKLLQPYYTLAQRGKRPVNFVQSGYAEYNDILNNFRVPLGDYQFRRSLFAQKYLYGTDWEKMYRFAFAREPIDRCLSAFSYLRKQNGDEHSFLGALQISGQERFACDDSYLFDGFLDLIETAQTSASIYTPVNLHFTTHTAPLWGDVVDENDNNMLTRVFRLESLLPAIDIVLDACGLMLRQDGSEIYVNVNADKSDFAPSRHQIIKIKRLYPNDFDIYERAFHA